MALKDPSSAPRNRTLTLTDEERSRYGARLVSLDGLVQPDAILNRTICQDVVDILDWLPPQFVDLLIIDPPYNLTKRFNERIIRQRSPSNYEHWLHSWFAKLVLILKPTASVYICSDWQSSSAVFNVLSCYCKVRSRITWEREKGRGATSNWKNCAEDIWFGTVSEHYYFNADAVRLKRRVMAPYTDINGHPKDWNSTAAGNFRLTAASNLWTDITIPFWSMPENTCHPTQKPEKLMAKLMLASSPEGAVVFDPFVGSGTTSVVARKLDRRFVGVEIDHDYACLTEKRLELALGDRRIQGYTNQVFWERNSLATQKQSRSE